MHDIGHHPNGQTFWIIGMVFLITSSLLGAVNFITTIIQLRAKGMTWMRLPFFVWAQLVTAFLLLLAFPPLEAAGVMQLMDNLLHTSFFLPTGLVVSGQPLHISGGGSPLLWQHLFWFLGHPEVYVLILPAMGIVTRNHRQQHAQADLGLPLDGLFDSGHRLPVVHRLGASHVSDRHGHADRHVLPDDDDDDLDSVGHHPDGAVHFAVGRRRSAFNTPMLFALAFLPMFGIGGLTGLPLGFNASDIHLHDTYYVIAHFHYIVAPGTIFALFAGIYYWFPKVTGRIMNEFWGKVHFGLSFIFMNLVFMPMFIQGMAGMSRRMYDGGATYAATPAIRSA